MQVEDGRRLPAPALGDDAVCVDVEDVEAVAGAVAPPGEYGEGGRPGLLCGVKGRAGLGGSGGDPGCERGLVVGDGLGGASADGVGEDGYSKVG